MARVFAFLSILLILAFEHPSEERSHSSPSPHGDTRMGADAVTTGTDITDKEIQAQEDKINPQEAPEVEDIEKEENERQFK